MIEEGQLTLIRDNANKITSILRDLTLLEDVKEKNKITTTCSKVTLDIKCTTGKDHYYNQEETSVVITGIDFNSIDEIYSKHIKDKKKECNELINDLKGRVNSLEEFI